MAKKSDFYNFQQFNFYDEDNEDFCDLKNMKEYKGVFFNEDIEKKYYEGGAHFSYKDLYLRLLDVSKIRSDSTLRSAKAEIVSLDKKEDVKKINYKKIKPRINSNPINLNQSSIKTNLKNLYDKNRELHINNNITNVNVNVNLNLNGNSRNQPGLLKNLTILKKSIDLYSEEAKKKIEAHIFRNTINNQASTTKSSIFKKVSTKKLENENIKRDSSKKSVSNIFRNESLNKTNKPVVKKIINFPGQNKLNFTNSTLEGLKTHKTIYRNSNRFVAASKDNQTVRLKEPESLFLINPTHKSRNKNNSLANNSIFNSDKFNNAGIVVKNMKIDSNSVIIPNAENIKNVKLKTFFEKTKSDIFSTVNKNTKTGLSLKLAPQIVNRKKMSYDGSYKLL